MKPNLDTLKDDIQTYLDEQGFAVFYGYSRMLDSSPIVYWDYERRPDYKAFLNTAQAAGVRIVVFHQREFSYDQVESALDHLQTCEMPLDEYRSIERRLKEMRAYDGFTCTLELSFDHDNRIYVFELQTEWYEEFSDLMEDLSILDSGPDEEQDDEDNPMGGYFSKN